MALTVGGSATDDGHGAATLDRAPSAPPGAAGEAPPLGAGDAVVALGLLAASVVVRAGALGPSSLWLDDAWVALATRADGVGEVIMVGNTAPGFVALVALVAGVAGFSELGAQLVPFAVGVLGAPVLYLLARRLGLSMTAALVGAGLLATSPNHVAYSTRVKPFTADALGAVAVLVAGWRVVERPAASRRWTSLAAVSVVTVVISAAAAVTVAAAFVAGLSAAGRHRPRVARPALLASAGVAAFAAAWWASIVRPATTPGLRGYWADHYVDVSRGPGAAAADVADGLAAVVRGFAALPPEVTVVGLALAAAVVVVRRPGLAILVLTPVAGAVALAALRLAPFGGGRTDVHLSPSLALVVALALHVGGARLSRPAAVCLAAGLTGALVLGVRPSPYPAEDLAPLVAIVEREARPDDAIAVYSASRWAYALYTSAPVDLQRDRRSANGFDVAVADERVEVLAPSRHDPAGHARAVDRLAAGHDRIWLISSHAGDDVAAIEELLADRGFDAVDAEARPGATLVLWSRGG